MKSVRLSTLVAPYEGGQRSIAFAMRRARLLRRRWVRIVFPVLRTGSDRFGSRLCENSDAFRETRRILMRLRRLGD